MTLSNIIGRRPTSATRPRYDRVAGWFVGGAGTHDVHAAVFTNVTEGAAGTIRPWLEAVRSIGFDVFVKPKRGDPDVDIDDDMLALIRLTHASRRLARLVVLSGDGRAFEDELQQLAEGGVEVAVVSFVEVASWARAREMLTFIDLEEIPGAFQHPLERIRLEDLPSEGAWLKATGNLRANFDPDPDPEVTIELETAS